MPENKVPIKIRDGDNDLQNMAFDDSDAVNGLVPYHRITGSIIIDSLTPVAVTLGSTTVTNEVSVKQAPNDVFTIKPDSNATFNVAADSTHALYVTSSAQNQVYVISAPQKATSTVVNLYTDDPSYTVGPTIIKPTAVGTIAEYYKFDIAADINRKSLIISNINSYSTTPDDFYVFIGGQVDNNDEDPVRYSFPLPSANVYIAEPGTAHLQHGLFVLKDTGGGYMALQVTKIT